ncbi:hypothetical protein [Caloramator australicus]|uniref:hypothetical protein n=1 Tax=Caloramator australicus TaxID=515264 RepID=UPI0012E9C3D1|nr:hypothetical protein [Caloramator australicus]
MWLKKKRPPAVTDGSKNHSDKNSMIAFLKFVSVFTVAFFSLSRFCLSIGALIEASDDKLAFLRLSIMDVSLESKS